MKKEMKKNLFMVAAVALMAMISCNKEQINEGQEPQAPQAPQVVEPSYYVEFTADLGADEEVVAPTPQSAATKTAYDAANKKTKWLAGDLISVNGKKFEIKEVLNGGLSARFVNAEELGENFNPPYTAIYPYNATAGQAVVPATQTVSDGTFADESVVAVGYSADDNVLSFKHMCSVVKFTVSTAGVTELEFSSAGDIAGTVSVNANAGADPTYSVKSGSKTITVKPTSGTFSTTATYYVSVLPTLGAATVKQKLEIKTEGVVVKSGNVHFTRNKVMDAKAIEVKYVYLKPNLIWGLASARYAAYFFQGTDNQWQNMVSIGDDVYRAIVPEGYTNLIFCRMNPSSTTNGWTANTQLWNQSPDLTVPSADNPAYISGIMKWDGAGSWNTLANAKSYRENAVYLKPNSNWKQSNARFAIYLCNGSKSAKWLSMTKVDDNFYGVELPSDFSATNYKNIIFCRMNGGNSTNDWSNKWNQSGDLACTKMTSSPYNRCCAINSGQWDCGSSVTWTTTLK